MKRSVSEVAKFVGVQPSQIKNWVLHFKEFLSASADPQKGKARFFDDSDLLVLSYIFTRWEDDPDVPSISAGLRQEEHHDEKLQELVYMNSPILQEPPDDLDETWRHGILLCGMGTQEGLELARNYRSIAENLLSEALSNGEAFHSSYPILFTYRHTLELYLKIIGKIGENTHSLARCVNLVEKLYGKKIGMPVRGWILELDEIDPAGTAFRYADGTQSGAGYKEQWLDLEQFKFAMHRTFEVIDRAIINSKGK